LKNTAFNITSQNFIIRFFDPLKLEKQNKQEEEKLDTTRKSKTGEKTEKINNLKKKYG
jgi:hypothetical protein